ncbi:MAG: DeoR/GlpR family DNA-binding transcription regulator [Chloroflexota bacterium]|jgi:DeoR/GlpR family transcriptional regulator of sugar metabolism
MKAKPVTNDDTQVARVRHLNILNILKENSTANIKDLAERLNISQSTIRRDLDELAHQGMVRRVFGGAILEQQNWNEPPFELRETLHAVEKDRLARRAAELVQDGDIIFIDGGTTTQFIVPYLANKMNLTVVTCGLNVAYKLNRLQNINTYVVGGELHTDSHSISGALALAVLDVYKIRCSKALIAASAVSAQFGVTNRILDRIPLKRKAIEISQQAFVLADGSKVGTVALGQIAPITDFAALVTDASAPEEEIEAIRALGVDVLIAEETTTPKD